MTEKQTLTDKAIDKIETLLDRALLEFKRLAPKVQKAKQLEDEEKPISAALRRDVEAFDAQFGYGSPELDSFQEQLDEIVDGLKPETPSQLAAFIASKDAKVATEDYGSLLERESIKDDVQEHFTAVVAAKAEKLFDTKYRPKFEKLAEEHDLQ